MADEIENQPEQILDDAPGTVENPDQGSGSPPDDGRLRALEEQLARERNEKQALAESVRLQERLLREQNAQRQPKADDSLSPELAALEQTLEPILTKRLKQFVEPLAGSQASSKEELDAIRFENFLTRHAPEVFDDEAKLAALNQQVHEVRQRAAREYQTWLSRQDAYGFVLGMESLKEKTQKKSQQARAETVRLGQGRLVASGNTGRTGRPATNDTDQAILKMRRGERLTPEERTKVREKLSSVEF